MIAFFKVDMYTQHIYIVWFIYHLSEDIEDIKLSILWIENPQVFVYHKKALCKNQRVEQLKKLGIQRDILNL